MGTKADGSLRYTVADTHHLHASYKDGNYDGRYAWVNDKINSRMARIRLDYFVCDKITETCPTCRASTASSRTSATRSTRRDQLHDARVRGGEFAHSALDGKDRRRPKYRSLFTCVDARPWTCAGRCCSTATATRRHLIRRQARGEQPVQHRDGRPLRGHDVRRARRLRVLQRGAHRGGRQGRQVQDPRRTRCRWSTAPRPPTRIPRPP